MLILPSSWTTAYGGPEGRARLEALLLAVAGGDREALAALYQSTRGAVYGLALSLLRSQEEAQDVTQDAFVRIWEKAPQYRPQGSPMAWMLAVVRNLALMRLRERGRFQPLAEEEWDAIPARTPGVTPEDRALLQTALGRLGDRERQVILLHAVSGLKHREIAALLELPLATVLSQYRRGLKKLKRAMEGEQPL